MFSVLNFQSSFVTAVLNSERLSDVTSLQDWHRAAGHKDPFPVPSALSEVAR